MNTLGITNADILSHIAVGICTSDKFQILQVLQPRQDPMTSVYPGDI